MWREVGLRHKGEGIDGLLCLSAVVHLAKHFREEITHIFGIAIHILDESLADTLKAISVHRKVHLGCVQFDGSVASLTRVCAFPLHGTMLCHSVVVNTYARIQPTSLIVIDDEVGCLLNIDIRILTPLAERTETCCLTLYALLRGRLHQKVHVDIGKSVYNRMEEHLFLYVLKKNSRR